MQDVARPLIFCCRSRVVYFFCVIFAPHFGHAGKENTQTGYKEEKDNMQQLKGAHFARWKMFRGRNTESGQFHQPSDGSHTDEVHGRGVRAPFRVARHQQDTDDRSQWHSSGIMVGYLLELPVVFAKKKKPSTMENMLVTKVFSFTKNNTYDVCVCKDYLQPGDKVLFIDDFLPMAMRLRA